MKSVARLSLALLFAAFAGNAIAAVPLDASAFTVYIQQKLQLYSPQPVAIVGPLKIGEGSNTADLATLHDQCVKTPAACDGLVHDFVQDFVRRGEAAAATPPPSADAPIPEDKDAFLALAASELQRRMPTAKITIDRMRLMVDRGAGKPVELDTTYVYRECYRKNFACRPQVTELIEELAIWLAPVRADTLRASLHIMDSCVMLMSVGSNGSCRITPSRDSLGVFFRRAFANLEVVCFKTLADGNLRPAINADRAMLGLDIDAALDLCIRQTKPELPALKIDPAGGSIAGPYAGSLPLLTEEWAAALGDRRILVAVPGRDLLLYSAGDSDADLAAFSAKTAQAFQAAGGLAVSADVFRWNGSKLVLATSRSVMINGGPTKSIDLIPREGGRGL